MAKNRLRELLEKHWLDSSRRRTEQELILGTIMCYMNSSSSSEEEDEFEEEEESSPVEAGKPATHGQLSIGEDAQKRGMAGNTGTETNPTKNRKVNSEAPEVMTVGGAQDNSGKTAVEGCTKQCLRNLEELRVS